MSYASLKTLRPFFTDQCGRLLAGGKIYTYESGTLTPKATFKDPAGLTENTNPIILDSSGEADIYIGSDYRFQVFSRDDVLINDVNSIASTQRISSAFLIDESGFNQAQINAAKEDKLNKGVAGGYPSLDENAKVPDEQISVVNDLVTDDAKKPVSAKQAKNLQDNKLDTNKRGAASGVASLDENKKVPISELPAASVDTAGVLKLVNDLITGGTSNALSAEMGKYIGDSAFGIGQSLYNMTGQRLMGVVYTNSSDKLMLGSVTGITASNPTSVLYSEVDGALFSKIAFGSVTWATIFFVVPARKTYMVSVESGLSFSVQIWKEYKL